MPQYYYEDHIAMLMGDTVTALSLLFSDMYVDVIVYEKMDVFNFLKSFLTLWNYCNKQFQLFHYLFPNHSDAYQHA